jgi:hypothetical protein
LPESTSYWGPNDQYWNMDEPTSEEEEDSDDDANPLLGDVVDMAREEYLATLNKLNKMSNSQAIAILESTTSEHNVPTRIISALTKEDVERSRFLTL